MYGEIVDDYALYEQLSLSWQRQCIERLTELMEWHDVEDPVDRIELLVKYFFQLAVEFDDGVVGGALRHKRRGYAVRLAFVDEKKTSKLIISKPVGMHDHVHSVVDDLVEVDDDDDE